MMGSEQIETDEIADQDAPTITLDWNERFAQIEARVSQLQSTVAQLQEIVAQLK